MSQPSPMTPADLANTIAAARASGRPAYDARRQLEAWGFEMCPGKGPAAGLRAAERYLALWQALEYVAANRNGCQCDPVGSGEELCTDACMARQALAQAAEKLQEALND